MTFDASAGSIVLIVVVGIFAGFVNTIAGGGSLLTLPALALAGLPWDVANGTNRVAVLMQSAVASYGFHRAGRLSFGDAGPLLLPTVIGAGTGAVLATIVDPMLLEPLIIAMLLIVGLLMTVRPRLVIAPPDAVPRTLAERPAAVLWLFIAGLYGGFLQAGVGYLLLAVLGGVLARDLTGANALKVFLNGVFTVITLAIFMANDLVHWPAGLLLGVASSIGSAIGVRVQLRVRQDILRWVILATLIGTLIAVLQT